MQTLDIFPVSRTTADILLVHFDKDRLNDYLKIAAAIRAAGIGVEVYPEAKKLGQQFKYAYLRGFPAVLVAGGNELDKGVVNIKWMPDGSLHEVPLSDNAC